VFIKEGGMYSDNVCNYRVMVLKLLYYVNMACVIMCSQAEGKRPKLSVFSVQLTKLWYLNECSIRVYFIAEQQNPSTACVDFYT